MMLKADVVTMPRDCRTGMRGQMPVSIGLVRLNHKRVLGMYVRLGSRGFMLFRVPRVALG